MLVRKYSMQAGTEVILLHGSQNRLYLTSWTLTMVVSEEKRPHVTSRQALSRATVRLVHEATLRPM